MNFGTFDSSQILINKSQAGRNYGCKYFVFRNVSEEQNFLIKSALLKCSFQNEFLFI